MQGRIQIFPFINNFKMQMIPGCAAGPPDIPDLRGKTVGIAVGSRGINRLPEFVRAVIEYIQKAGGKPSIFPTMGSHGGTEAGQISVLEGLGISQQTMGVPIRACAGSKLLCTTASGYAGGFDSGLFRIQWSLLELFGDFLYTGNGMYHCLSNHYLRIFGSAVLMSLISGGSAYAMDSMSGGNGNGEDNTPTMQQEMASAFTNAHSLAQL